MLVSTPPSERHAVSWGSHIWPRAARCALSIQPIKTKHAPKLLPASRPPSESYLKVEPPAAVAVSAMAPAADEAPPLGTGGSDSRAQVLVVVRAHPVPPALCAVRDELGKEVGKCTMVGVGDAAGDGGWRCAHGRCRPQVSPKSFGTRVRGIDTNQMFQTPVTGLN